MVDLSRKNAEQILEKCINTGSASRKLDGIMFSFKNKEDLELGIISGLNCSSKTTKSPLHNQMIESSGDDAAIMDESN